MSQILITAGLAIFGLLTLFIDLRTERDGKKRVNAKGLTVGSALFALIVANAFVGFYQNQAALALTSLAEKREAEDRKTIASLRDEVSSHSNKLEIETKELRDTIQAQSITITSLTDGVSGLTASNGNLQQQVTRLENTNFTLASDNRQLQSRIAQLTGSIDRQTQKQGYYDAQSLRIEQERQAREQEEAERRERCRRQASFGDVYSFDCGDFKAIQDQTRAIERQTRSNNRPGYRRPTLPEFGATYVAPSAGGTSWQVVIDPVTGEVTVPIIVD